MLSDSADFLGRSVVYLQEASTNLGSAGDENEVPAPKWHDIRIGLDDSTPACGQVLVSFVVAEQDFDFQTPA